MATIQEVARRAQVSAATVSRVLNGNGKVDPVLVRRVRAAVEALAYQPNSVARNLRRRESSLWAVIVPDVGNPFFTSMVRGVEDVGAGRRLLRRALQQRRRPGQGGPLHRGRGRRADGRSDHLPGVHAGTPT